MMLEARVVWFIFFTSETWLPGMHQKNYIVQEVAANKKCDR